MFLEAYANGGRWGYYWWPGVDPETRRRHGPRRAEGSHRLHRRAPRPLRAGGAHERPRDRVPGRADVPAADAHEVRGPRTGARGARVPVRRRLRRGRRVQRTTSTPLRSSATGPSSCPRPETSARCRWLRSRHTRGQAASSWCSRRARSRPTSLGTRRTMLLDFWREYRDADRDRISAAMERFDASRIELGPDRGCGPVDPGRSAGPPPARLRLRPRDRHDPPGDRRPALGSRGRAARRPAGCSRSAARRARDPWTTAGRSSTSRRSIPMPSSSWRRRRSEARGLVLGRACRGPRGAV